MAQKLMDISQLPSGKFPVLPGIKTRCAISQLCSPGYAVKSPSLTPLRIWSRGPATFLEKRFSSQTSFINSWEDIKSRSVPARLSLKISPVSVSFDMANGVRRPYHTYLLVETSWPLNLRDQYR